MREKDNNWLKYSAMGSVAEDEFARDAADGFAMFPSAGSKIGLLGLKFNILLIKKAWIMLSIPAKIMIASAIVSITGVVIITSNSSQEMFYGQNQAPYISQSSQMDSSLAQNENTDTISISQTEKSSTYSDELIADYDIPKEIDKVMSRPEMVELIGYSPICNSSTSTTIVSSYPTPIYWIDEYRIIDYSKLRDDVTLLANMEFEGLNAKYENQNMVSEDDEYVTRDTIPYIQYASSALTYLKNGFYKESINKWSLVLSQYPDDENALFYIAYSNFLSKDYQKALQYFNKAESGYFQVFDEESRWFIAQCLIELKRLDEAKKILKSIIDQNAHYTQQAKILLEKLP